MAYRDGDDVTESYLRCLQVLMAGSGYPMVASHDPQIIAAVPAIARENGRGVDDFEYQMLYGIRDGEQRRLTDEGNHVRVYVPVRLLRSPPCRASSQPDVLPAGACGAAALTCAEHPRHTSHSCSIWLRRTAD